MTRITLIACLSNIKENGSLTRTGNDIRASEKAGWIKAIQEAQQTVQKGLKLDCPILVMSSNKSFPETETWHEEYMTSDIVLDVSRHSKNTGRN